jgi:WhiB family redox-sensing transcriptional regulator
MNWIEEAECRGLPSDIFFPPELGDDDGTAGYNQDDYDATYGRAKAICNTCAVRVECLQFALDNKERWGVWGGLIPIERLRIERKYRRQRLRDRRAAEAHSESDIPLSLEDDDDRN